MASIALGELFLAALSANVYADAPYFSNAPSASYKNQPYLPPPCPVGMPTNNNARSTEHRTGAEAERIHTHVLPDSHYEPLFALLSLKVGVGLDPLKLASVMVDAFEDESQIQDAQYIEEMLLQIMADEFETNIGECRGSCEGYGGFVECRSRWR